MTSGTRTMEIVLDKERIRLLEGYCFNIAVENIETYDKIFFFENDRRFGPILKSEPFPVSCAPTPGSNEHQQ
jgi:hypothetical protein